MSSWVFPDDITAWLDQPWRQALERFDRAYERVRQLQAQLDDATDRLDQAVRDLDATRGTPPHDERDGYAQRTTDRF